MKLSKSDCDRFFKLMWGLQYYVSQKNQRFADVTSPEEYAKLGTEDKLPARTELFDNPKLINEFVAENPQQFSQSDLDIVSSWKHAVSGNFYVERLLKKHAIFISDEPEKVYAVLALYDSFEDMIPKAALPQMVQAILLPFEGKIIYDGLLQGYNVFFGSGIKGNLKEIYMSAKQNGRIITNLLQEPDSSKATVLSPIQSWEAEIEAMIKIAKKLRGGGGQSPLCSPTFSLVRASLELAQLAAANSKDFDRALKTLKKCDRSLAQAESAIYRGLNY